MTSQAQLSQTPMATPGKDLNQQSISSSQAHPVVLAAVPTPEQWYQQQQQLYQQYYQQYPGYDPSQRQYQHYYPYQQAAVPQYQQHAHASNATGQLQPPLPQLQLQPQTQPQPQLSQSQPQASHIQAAVATQPQNQTQVVPPHSQIQSQTYPPTPGQPYPQPQIHQQSQLQAQPHTPPSQPRSLSQAQLLGQLQPNPQPNQPPTANFQSQTQQPSAHVVTGHHSFPQPQNPVQMQSQHPKQAPLMHPPRSHATTASQTRPALLPSPGQVQNTPPAQQQSVQQSGQPVHQRLNMQPVQQTFPHQHYVQQQPMPSQLRPTGQSHLFPPQTHAYPQPTVQHPKSPNLVGGRSMPNLGVQAQPNSQHAGGVMRPSYPGTNQQAPNQGNMLKTNIQMQLPSEQQSGENSKATMYERQVNHIFETGAARQEVEASSLMPFNVHDVKTEKSKTDLKSTNLEHKSAEDKAEQTCETYLSKGDSFLQKKSPLKAVERHEGQGGNLVMEAVSGSDGGSKGVPVSSAQILTNPAPGGEVKSLNPHGFQDKSRPQVSGVEFQCFPHSSQVQAHQLPGPASLLQVPPPGPPHQTQGPGAPQIHFRPQLPGHPLHPHDGIPGSALPFERGPGQSGLGQQSSELQSVAPQGPYNRGPSGASRFSQGEPIGAQGSVLLPPHAFDSHGGTMARAAPHGPEIFPNQRPNFMDGRGFDPYGPVGSRDERFNPFPAGSNYRPEFEDDLRQFPRPFDWRPHGLKFDTGLKMDSGVGSVSSRFLSPCNGGGANDAGECLGGHHEDTFGRMDPTRGRLDFMGPGPGYGVHHIDSWGSRSPGRELPGISSRGFRGAGPDDIHGRESGRFGEPFGGSFHGSRFPMLPGHQRWVEFDGPHNMGRGEHLRNDFIGPDNFAGPLRWREHLGGPHGRSPLGEPVGFGAHPLHSRIREMGGPGSFDPFGRGDGPSFPRLGEPGFRSRFSPHGFPTDDGIFTVKSLSLQLLFFFLFYLIFCFKF